MSFKNQRENEYIDEIRRTLFKQLLFSICLTVSFGLMIAMVSLQTVVSIKYKPGLVVSLFLMVISWIFTIYYSMIIQRLTSKSALSLPFSIVLPFVVHAVYSLKVWIELGKSKDEEDFIYQDLKEYTRRDVERMRIENENMLKENLISENEFFMKEKEIAQIRLEMDNESK